PRVRYRQRLIEAMLSGESPRAHGLGSFTTRIGGSPAIALGFAESDEAAALLTLLAIYERKSSAHFHAVLKMLCDLYGLRKDELDRVANEHGYLASMNAARSDKQRILDFARPGRIVEVGPGGGVVLDLLADRFPDSEVIGIDASAMAVDALRARRAREGRRWSVIHADAFELARHVGPAPVDTVIFCSILHEIYSYVEPRFSLDSVRRILRAAWDCLAAGGRLLIRDGVAPPPGTRLLRFVAADAREFFDLFCAQFEGRRIGFEEVGDGRVRLPAADAMEFLYTYTWGPESFPYEVREQYGVLAYGEYRASILARLPGARAVALPPDLESYLQDGYVTALAGKVELVDERGVPCPLPDSNCVMVFERT
ncbi:MAG TPA: methyltransferase, partial [Planctomycetota bacterium]|nr:methyltransferase [Planctomycetota bacterium]